MVEENLLFLQNPKIQKQYLCKHATSFQRLYGVVRHIIETYIIFSITQDKFLSYIAVSCKTSFFFQSLRYVINLIGL